MPKMNVMTLQRMSQGSRRRKQAKKHRRKLKLPKELRFQKTMKTRQKVLHQLEPQKMKPEMMTYKTRKAQKMVKMVKLQKMKR